MRCRHSIVLRRSPDDSRSQTGSHAAAPPGAAAAGGGKVHPPRRVREAIDRASAQTVFTEIASSRSVVVYRRTASAVAPLLGLSESVRDVLGYTGRSLRENGERWLSLVHRDYHDDLTDLLAQVQRTDRAMREYEILAADGEYRWIRDEMRLVRDEEGKPVEIVGCWLDLTPYTFGVPIQT